MLLGFACWFFSHLRFQNNNKRKFLENEFLSVLRQEKVESGTESEAPSLSNTVTWHHKFVVPKAVLFYKTIKSPENYTILHKNGVLWCQVVRCRSFREEDQIRSQVSSYKIFGGRGSIETYFLPSISWLPLSVSFNKYPRLNNFFISDTTEA